MLDLIFKLHLFVRRFVAVVIVSILYPKLILYIYIYIKSNLLTNQ